MTAGPRGFPEHRTFSQRYGYKPLPEPMNPEQISDDLRREIWNIVWHILRDNAYVSGNEVSFKRSFRDAIRRTWGNFKKIPESRILSDATEMARDIEKTILSDEFNTVLDFLEILIDEEPTYDFADNLKVLFDKYGAAYWLDMSQQPYRFTPCASREQGEAARQAIETLHEGGMDGAAKHFRQAGEAMKVGRYADSVRESIHAVESVARRIDPDSNNLGRALHSLEQQGLLKHSALKQGFEKFYGFTNTEQGIRHALLDKDAADVGLEEAVFMFGACASFAAYLTQKHRQAGGA